MECTELGVGELVRRWFRKRHGVECVAGGCEILGAAYDEMKMCVEAFRESTEVQSVFIVKWGPPLCLA